MSVEDTDKRLSIPTICSELLPDTDGQENGAELKENKLIQRRRLMHEQQTNSPHFRSSSFRNRPRPKLLNVEIPRPRRSSLPSPSRNLLSVSFEDINRPKEPEPLTRVRSFKTTRKGELINRGDSFKRSCTSINSTGSNRTNDTGHSIPIDRQRCGSSASKDSGTANSTASSDSPTVYSVAVLGKDGVGKTSLCNQFMTSEFIAFENDNDETSDDRYVPVLLNSEESTLRFVDRPLSSKELEDTSFDAYIVVYSITDRTSFQTAVDHLYAIRNRKPTKRPTILIANKIDLVRKKKVSKEEGLSIAHQYNCKYTETSAALNHHVDELLVGILSQIRLVVTPGVQVKPPTFSPKKQNISGPRRLLNKIFKKHEMKEAKNSIENLFKL